MSVQGQSAAVKLKNTSCVKGPFSFKMQSSVV